MQPIKTLVIGLLLTSSAHLLPPSLHPLSSIISQISVPQINQVLSPLRELSLCLVHFPHFPGFERLPSSLHKCPSSSESLCWLSILLSFATSALCWTPPQNLSPMRERESIYRNVGLCLSHQTIKASWEKHKLFRLPPYTQSPAHILSINFISY